jgi:sugar/nucleoside kinase (ribokinase family)
LESVQQVTTIESGNYFMQKKYDVCGIGNALVDIVFQVSEAFLEKHNIKKGVMTLVDEEIQSRLIHSIEQEEVTQNPGGSAANTITSLSQLGGAGFYCCKVASDDFGQTYIEHMQQAGVATNFDERRPPSGITGKCLVMITDDAERTMNSYLGISSTLSVDEIDEPAVKKSRYVYIEGYLVTGDSSFEAMKRIKKMAAENSVKTALTLSDPSVAKAFRSRFDEITATPLDLLFCNEEEAKIFTQKNDLPEACEILKKIAKNFVITRGKEGALIYDGRNQVQIQPEKVNVVDTNGAGDVFAGAFLYGITHGMTVENAGKLANRAGSKVVSTYGPRLEKSELQQILRTIS